MPSLGNAIHWIAENDSAGDDESPEELAGLVTVLLVADLFDKDPADIAKRVYKVRHPEADKKPELLASAGTFDGILKRVREYYGKTIWDDWPVLRPCGQDVYSVFKIEGQINHVRVIRTRGRYRFERV